MATQQHHDESMTLEQIEAHLKSANIEQYASQGEAKGVAPAASLDLGATLKKICGVYRGIRPILVVVVNFPLIPASVKNAIRTFMSVMDPICP